MKLIKLLWLILSFFPQLIIAQEVFTDSYGKEYIYLGSTQNQKQNFLNTGNGSIEWINISTKQNMTQAGILSPSDFWNKLTQNSIGFHASGYEPFWDAKINQNQLQFISEKEGSTNIVIDLKNSSLTHNFVAFFHSHDNIYGFIRSVSTEAFCEASLDEPASIYEVYIDYQGKIFEGCAYLDKL